MCHRTGIEFVRDNLKAQHVEGKNVLEVGALDVNGTIRPTLEAFGPASYIGVDITPGSGVDEICDVQDLVSRFGPDSFHVVVASELVEHVRDWRGAFQSMKRVLRPGGVIVVTTRSKGFKIHGYPYDFWRYEPADMDEIFADFDDVKIDTDRIAPGVFILATKPPSWAPADLDPIRLYSVVAHSRVEDISDIQEWAFEVRYHAHQTYRRALPEGARARVKRLVLRRR